MFYKVNETRLNCIVKCYFLKIMSALPTDEWCPPSVADPICLYQIPDPNFSIRDPGSRGSGTAS
jgi:hypothetical protein